MILVDTSVWVDHLRGPDPRLTAWLIGRQVWLHPFVLGELALGGLAQRERVISFLRDLPSSPVAEPDEVLTTIERCGLTGTGVGYVDAHLLAATLILRGSALWTRDRKLAKAADSCGAPVISDVH